MTTKMACPINKLHQYSQDVQYKMTGQMGHLTHMHCVDLYALHVMHTCTGILELCMKHKAPEKPGYP